MVRAAPGLFNYARASLEAKRDALLAATNASPREVAAAARAYPSLLLTSVDVLIARVRLVEQLRAQSPAWSKRAAASLPSRASPPSQAADAAGEAEGAAAAGGEAEWQT